MERKNAAAFCRFEGGIYRPLLMSDTGINYKDHLHVHPKTSIERLMVSEKRLKEIQVEYEKLHPGQMLIVFDSDSNDIENRIGEVRII